MSLCSLCPRKCNIDRASSAGFCGANSDIRIARIAPHYFEEPPISHKNGSGTIFFCGCNLRCVFCQNRDISRSVELGKNYSAKELSRAILELQESGVHNINFVTPTHYADKIAEILEDLRSKNLLLIPTVYNSSGYESVETLRHLDGLIDIYLPDLKYFSSEISQKYSSAPNYFEVATDAISEMLRQTGKYRYNEADTDLLASGVIIRHLVLPSHRADSIDVFTHLAELIDPCDVLVSIMSQYTPDFAKDCEYKNLHRRVTSFEYGSVCEKVLELGFTGFMQSRSSSDKSYTPDFKN